MQLTGTRGLIRVALNKDCQFLAGMFADRGRRSEQRIYQDVTGHPYPGDYGERPSARARGVKFEEELTKNNAESLRNDALAGVYGLDPTAIRTRNFADELPGGASGDLHAARLARTRSLLRDLAAGKTVPELVLWPQFRLPVGHDATDRSFYMYVSPDGMILDPARRIYVPVEFKSFIVRDGVPDPAALEAARLQAGAEILALRAEAWRVGIGDRVAERALFVFASHKGMLPLPVKEEALEAAVHQIARTLPVYEAMYREIHDRRRRDPGMRTADLYYELPVNFQESCVGRCIFAEECQQRAADRARSLGDGAVTLGANANLDRTLALVRGTVAPADPAEAEIAVRLRDGLAALGISIDNIRRVA